MASILAKYAFGISFLASQLAHSQMPVPLMDSFSDSMLEEIQAALECRATLDIKTAEIQKLLVRKDGLNWALTPPEGFTVLGLPIQSAKVSLARLGESRFNYETRYLASAKEVKQALKHRKAAPMIIEGAKLIFTSKGQYPVTRCIVVR